VVAACETVPLALASVVGAPLVDRLGPRRTAVLSDLLSACFVGAVPVLHATVGIAFWQLCLLVALGGLVRAPGETSRYVLLPRLVELAQTPVERAVSAYDGVSRGARMLGAPLAGAAIAVIGPANVLLLDAGSFVVSALLLVRLVPSVEAEPSPASRYLHQLRDGLGQIRRDRLLRQIVLMVMVTNAIDASVGAVLLPVYAHEVLHSAVAQGALMGAFGLGALTGTTLYGLMGHRLPRWPVYTIAFLTCGSPRMLALAGDVPLPALVVVFVVAGLAAGALNPVLSVVELERIPVPHRARVYGAISAGVLIGMPLGAVLAGLGAGSLGVHLTLLLGGTLYLGATLVPVVWARVWREMDAAPATGEQAAAA
jgi:MFS family permease